jgi:hypothetical protein
MAATVGEANASEFFVTKFLHVIVTLRILHAKHYLGLFTPIYGLHVRFNIHKYVANGSAYCLVGLTLKSAFCEMCNVFYLIHTFNNYVILSKSDPSELTWFCVSSPYESSQTFWNLDQRFFFVYARVALFFNGRTMWNCGYLIS